MELSFDQVLKFVRDVGVPVSLVIFFVWWAFKREEKMGARLDKVQDDMTETHKTVIKDCTDAMNNSADAVREIKEARHEETQVLRTMTDRLQQLSCMNPPWDGKERRRP